MKRNKLWISTGKSRNEVSWKNQEVSWSKLIDRLRKPVITGETYDKYCKLSKDEQSQIKDVGGFVGGVVSGGRRLKNSVSSRHLITLDLDYATTDFWLEFCMEYNCEAVLYSTHKHSPQTPRYRLLIPLAEEILSDQYEAVGRKIAGNLNIEYFDPTTFQPERLMYWPSVSVDGVYEFQHQQGEWLDGMAVLEEYEDWRDVSQWPVSSKFEKRIRGEIAKQQDPLDKEGVVGVFCRTYGVEEAIEKFLGEVYEPTGIDGRWTFKEGSTSGGLVVYDNKFCFSHHATDPVSGRLCNAFDLVRIHLFGDSDDRVDDKTPLNKKPSYGKMIERILKDEEVKKNVVVERLDSKRVVESDDSNWMSKLELDPKGKSILNTINNVVLVIENDEMLKGAFGYDDLRKIPTVRKDLPWRKVEKYSRGLTDADDAQIRNYLEIMYGLTQRDKIKDGLDIAIHKNKFHPVKDYLKGLKWDGKERVDRLLVEYLGAEDSGYVREVTRKTLVAAVARVFEPGIKFDTVLVLVGPQGVGKSRLVSKLGGEWFSDTFGNLQNKDAMEQIQGVWIMEIGELAGLKRQEVETIKLFISKQEDRFRVAYGRRVETFARQCIFIGTTNKGEFLQDETGNRRFWPVQCGSKEDGRVDELGKEEVNQIWAEACYWYVMCENLHLDREIEGIAGEVQQKYTERSDFEGLLTQYLETMVPKNWYELDVYERREFLSRPQENGELMLRNYITIPEIWTELFNGQIREMTRVNTKQHRTLMNAMPGWKPKLITRKPWGTQRGWIRLGSTEDDEAQQDSKRQHKRG